MFQFRRFPAYTYLIQCRLTEYCSAGFPHSEICGSMLMCSSPQLIAACHVLHRLLMPRHSPCALISLTFVEQPISKLFSSSIRIMQASVWFIVVCVTLISKVHKKLCYLSVACSQFLACFTVQFSRCSFRPFSRSDRNIQSLESFDPILSGGGYRARTGDPLLAKQVLFQLS